MSSNLVIQSKDTYQLRGYLIQHQILQTNIIRHGWQTIRGMMTDILKVRALRIKFSIHCMPVQYLTKLTLNLHIIQCDTFNINSKQGRGAKKTFPSK